MNRRRAVRLLATAVGVAAVGTAVVVFTRSGVPGIDQLRAGFGRHHWWQPVLFAGLYALATLTPLPKAVLSLAAGALFGVTVGLPVVLVGATAGALAAFALTRMLARGIHGPGVPTQHLRLGRVLVRYRVHADRLHRLLEDNGLLTVIALRLVPVVPFTALNYAAGLTRVRTWHFAAGTAVGMIPASAAYVTLGAYGARPGGWPGWISLAGLLLLSVAGICIKRARHATEIRAGPEATVDRRSGAPASPLADCTGAPGTPTDGIGTREP